MKNQIVGYVVEGSEGVMALSYPVFLDEKMGLMMWATTATLFSTRKAAQQARQRTLKYTKNRGWNWGIGRVKAVRKP